MKTHTKHPLAIEEIVFDFSKALAALGDTPVWYAILNDGGVTTEVISSVSGVYKMLVGGGKNGTAYNFGMQLLTSDGVVAVDVRQMRVRGVEIDGYFDAVGNTPDQFLDGGSIGNVDGGFMDGGV